MNAILKQTSDLVLFATIVQAGSITLGAKKLGMERSTVSRRMTAFERRLGTTLLDRSTKYVSMTDAGHRCYRHSLRILQATKEATAAARGALDTGVSSTLRVGALAPFIESVIRPLLDSFCQQHPEVHIDLQVLQDLKVDRHSRLDLALIWDRDLSDRRIAGKATDSERNVGRLRAS